MLTELTYNWTFVGIVVGAGLLLYLVSWGYHRRMKKQYSHLLDENTYCDPEVLAHSEEDRVLVLPDVSKNTGDRTHPEFGPLVLRVGGRVVKNLVIAGGILAIVTAAAYVFSQAPERMDPDSVWAHPLGILVLLGVPACYALYRLYLATSSIQLYRSGMVYGTPLLRRELPYNDIAQIQGHEYLKRRQARGDSFFAYRRAWECRIIRRNGKVVSLSDSRYAALRRRLDRWQEGLTWEPKTADSGFRWN